jgi:hypothetical protein
MLLLRERKASVMERRQSQIDKEVARLIGLRILSRFTYLTITGTRVVQKLSPYDFQIKHRYLQDRRIAKTGTWLLDHEHFQVWMTGPSYSSLWCQGIGTIPLSAILIRSAGSGKSVLAYFRSPDNEAD